MAFLVFKYQEEKRVPTYCKKKKKYKKKTIYMQMYNEAKKYGNKTSLHN